MHKEITEMALLLTGKTNRCGQVKSSNPHPFRLLPHLQYLPGCPKSGELDILWPTLNSFLVGMVFINLSYCFRLTSSNLFFLVMIP